MCQITQCYQVDVDYCTCYNFDTVRNYIKANNTISTDPTSDSQQVTLLQNQ